MMFENLDSWVLGIIIVGIIIVPALLVNDDFIKKQREHEKFMATNSVKVVTNTVYIK